MEEEEELLCVSQEAGGAVFGGWSEVYVLLMGLKGGQGERRNVRGTMCAERVGDVHGPTGWEQPVPRWGTSPCSHTLVYSCTSPWPCRPRPPYLCPTAQHCLISPGARSRCADALVPAPDSQPLALAAAFLEQLREGWHSQDCLKHGVNVTLPQALIPAGRGCAKPALGQRCLWSRTGSRAPGWARSVAASSVVFAPALGQKNLCGVLWQRPGRTMSCRVLERGAGVEVMGCGRRSRPIAWPRCRAQALSVLFP